ncbi:MAG: thiolase family protein [Candidatus Melainabacteria bacterium]|nr:thiolase family protein [Candidatus Melainabacteria bacterium]
MKKQKVLLAAVSRTPIGKLGGKLSRVAPAKLGAHVLKAAIRRAGIEHLSWIDVIAFGHTLQSFFEPNTARFSAFNEAHLPASIEAYTIQEQCASGMKAAQSVYDRIASGEAELGIAVGVESMSLAPLIIPGQHRYSEVSKQALKRFKKLKLFGPLPFFGLAESGLGPLALARDPEALNMIKTAQIVADLMDVSRPEADRFALLSQQRALSHRQRLALEIDAMVVAGVGLVSEDEHPRFTDLNALAALKDQAGTGVVTAGNASGMGDGASALVMCTESMAEKLGLTPLAEIVDFHFSGRHARSMGLGPVNAVTGLLTKQGLSINDIDYFELNEAFAAQAVACLKRLGIPVEKVNHNGGGISLSHPLGMSGARIIGAAAYEMQVDPSINTAICTLCVGGGIGGAALLVRYRN